MTTGDSDKPDLAYRRLASVIRDRIKQGTYRPGERIPPVRGFASEGYSSVTVKSAFELLRTEGWITSPGRGAGTFVCNPTPETQPSLEERVAALERRLEAHEARDHPKT